MALPVNRVAVTIDITRTNPAYVVTTRPNRVQIKVGPNLSPDVTGRITIGGVEMGDTGWRDISSLISGATVTDAVLNRQGHTVRMYLDITVTTYTDAAALLVLPSGFAPPNIGFNAWYGVLTDPYTYEWGAIVRRAGLSEVQLYGTSTTRRRLVGSWYSSEPWPTTLPGTPA